MQHSKHDSEYNDCMRQISKNKRPKTRVEKKRAQIVWFLALTVWAMVSVAVLNAAGPHVSMLFTTLVVLLIALYPFVIRKR